MLDMQVMKISKILLLNKFQNEVKETCLWLRAIAIFPYFHKHSKYFLVLRNGPIVVSTILFFSYFDRFPTVEYVPRLQLSIYDVIVAQKKVPMERQTSPSMGGVSSTV